MKLTFGKHCAMSYICLSHFFLFLAIIGTDFVSSMANNETDSYWLLRIISELIDPLGALSNWSPTTHMSNWNGLTCSLDQEHVIGLNLSGSGISGSISVEFNHLSYLQTLDLYSKSLTGSIPSKLFKR
ncbi:hypothetical protein S245_037889 [Arachis hypogaea]